MREIESRAGKGVHDNPGYRARAGTSRSVEGEPTEVAHLAVRRPRLGERALPGDGGPRTDGEPRHTRADRNVRPPLDPVLDKQPAHRLRTGTDPDGDPRA